VKMPSAQTLFNFQTALGIGFELLSFKVPPD